MKSYNELGEYLLENIDKADEKQSKANPLFCRLQMWELYITMCMDNAGKDLLIKTAYILIANVKKDF